MSLISQDYRMLPLSFLQQEGESLFLTYDLNIQTDKDYPIGMGKCIIFLVKSMETKG